MKKLQYAYILLLTSGAIHGAALPLWSYLEEAHEPTDLAKKAQALEQDRAQLELLEKLELEEEKAQLELLEKLEKTHRTFPDSMSSKPSQTNNIQNGDFVQQMMTPEQLLNTLTRMYAQLPISEAPTHECFHIMNQKKAEATIHEACEAITKETQKILNLDTDSEYQQRLSSTDSGLQTPKWPKKSSERLSTQDDSKYHPYKKN